MCSGNIYNQQAHAEKSTMQVKAQFLFFIFMLVTYI
jgi:hypothetical protein